jgi:rubredoxin
MRHDELIDDLGRRMAAEDFARFVEIDELLQRHAQAMQELETELELLVVSYGLVGDIADGRHPNQPTTNVWWRKTPADWRCPYCRRTKAQILRPDRHGPPSVTSPPITITSANSSTT